MTVEQSAYNLDKKISIVCTSVRIHILKRILHCKIDKEHGKCHAQLLQQIIRKQNLNDKHHNVFYCIEHNCCFLHFTQHRQMTQHNDTTHKNVINRRTVQKSLSPAAHIHTFCKRKHKSGEWSTQNSNNTKRIRKTHRKLPVPIKTP